MNNYIFLCGQKSCGKTTTAKKLKTLLTNSICYDTDSLLLNNFKAEKIVTLYKSLGEKKFRKEERDTFFNLIENCEKNFSDKKIIISLGGGSCECKGILDKANNIGKSIYLYLNPEILYERLKINGFPEYLKKEYTNEEQRYKDYENIFNKRHLIYSKKCNFMIDLNKKTEDEVALIIINSVA